MEASKTYGIMTNEEKQLLLKDLSARLLYGVNVQCSTKNETFDFILYGINGVELISKTKKEEKTYAKGIVSHHLKYPLSNTFLGINCKPYLRPMSSMTEEENKEWWEQHKDYESVDWLNSHHFDYRGLIEKGLAIEAPDRMYL